MLETTLLDLDNDSLKKEYEFYQTISSKSSNQEARNAYLQELEKLFDSADKNHDHRVQRNEFESLIITYFQMKNITPSKENFDKYFE